MIGSTMALLTRALQVDSRLLRHQLGRLLFVFIIYFSLVYARLASDFLGAPGLQLFQMMAWMNVIIITLAALGFFASAITEEKEEETLGLLKMAGVRPVSLLLGKSTSRLMTAGVLLSLQFPFTLLAITLGGVSIDQVWAVYLALLAYIALVANLALFFSVAAERTRGAASGVFLVLLVFFGGPPLVQYFCVSTNWNQSAPWVRSVADFCLVSSEWLISVSPAKRIERILASDFTGSPFSIQVISNFAAAGFLFLLSWWTFEYFTRSRASSVSSGRLSFGTSGAKRLFGSGRAWQLSLVWKDFNFIAGGWSMACVKFVLYLLLVALFAGLQYHWHRRVDIEDLGGTTMIAMLIAGCIEISLVAGRVFNLENRWKTWATLRMLPKALPEIAYSKVAGSLLTLGPALAVMGIGACMYPEGFLDFCSDAIQEWGVWVAVLVFGFFIHLVALLSLYVKWGALPLAIGIMMVGYMLFGMCMFIVVITLSPTGAGFVDAEAVIASVFIILFLAANIGMEVIIGLRLRQLASM